MCDAPLACRFEWHLLHMADDEAHREIIQTSVIHSVLHRYGER